MRSDMERMDLKLAWRVIQHHHNPIKLLECIHRVIKSVRIDPTRGLLKRNSSLDNVKAIIERFCQGRMS